MPVVTIARQLGSGGEAIAAEVARLLSARLFDRELLALAAEQTGIPVATLASLDERGRSMLRRPLDLVDLVPLPPIDPEVPDVTGDRYPPTGPLVARGEGLVAPKYWAAEAYATLLARVMRQVAAAGDAVIVGRAGNEALAGVPGVLHVLVIASEAQRIRRVMEEEGIHPFAARDRVRESDRQRTAFSRQFFQRSWTDPTRYDLVVNTDRLSFGAAAAVIAAAAGALGEDAPAVAPAEAAPVAAG